VNLFFLLWTNVHLHELDVLRLPGRLSHFIQPFDTGIVSLLMAYFKRERIAQIDRVLEADLAKREQSFILREI
jgi:hypothetical protein